MTESNLRTDARKPRVLFINTRSALGADVAVHLCLIQNFDPEQIDAFIATNRNSADLNKTMVALSKAPKTIVRVCNLGHELSTQRGLGKLGNLVKNIGTLNTVLRLALWIRREKIDILHTTDRPRDAALTTLLARLTGARTVMHLHIEWYPEIGRATTWSAREAGAIIAISHFVRQSLINNGIPSEKIFTTYNATDTTLFDPVRVQRGFLREKLGIPMESPLVGIIARIMEPKGQLDLVEAFAKVHTAVPDARLVIVGRHSNGVDSYENEIRRRIQELHLEEHVHWAGWLDEIPEVMADLDVTALPSWDEPFGLVVTESMAMERPVVAYCSGALSEIITDGIEGFLVPREDIHALADRIIQLLKDPEGRKEMGRRGRERVLKQFTARRQAAEVESLYRALIAGVGINNAPPVTL